MSKMISRLSRGWVVKSLTLIVVGLAGGIASSQPVFAQAAYGSYVGVGGTVGVSGRGDRTAGAVISGRYRILEAPISLRAQGLISNGGVAVIPTVSYDVPLNWQTEAYLGAGISIPGGNNSPVGDKVSFALQPGLDYAIPDTNTVIFGNAVIAFDAYRNGGGTAVSVQGGVGFQFR
jgi:hypothetical protein